MEHRGPMPHSQGLSNNLYPEHNQPNSKISSHLRLGLPKGIFPIGVPVKILKVSTNSILVTLIFY